VSVFPFIEGYRQKRGEIAAMLGYVLRSLYLPSVKFQNFERDELKKLKKSGSLLKIFQKVVAEIMGF
jgi:hypothetical protein